jgi:hypothetical protein
MVNLFEEKKINLFISIFQYELSTGYYPFSESKSVFDILQRIVEEPSLKLTVDRLSDHCKDFVNTW